MENKGNVLVFKHPDFESVRVVTVDDEPWFVGTDVAKALGYAKPLEAVNTNVSEVDSTLMGVTDSVGRIQQTKVINESGMYDLVFGSRLESAKRFRRWVTSEVLPSIRKTGKYDLTESYKIDDPIERAKAWIKEQEERKQLKRRTRCW